MTERLYHNQNMVTNASVVISNYNSASGVTLSGWSIIKGEFSVSS